MHHKVLLVSFIFDNYRTMKKITLQFDTLIELTNFSKGLYGGYVLNTNTLTLAAKLHEVQLGIALELHGAIVLETTEIYSPMPMMN